MHFLEYGILGTVCAGAGLFFAFAGNPVAPQDRKAVDTFTVADFDRFDRGFEMNGNTCDVGMKSQKLCFRTSPLEDKLVIGEPLPRYAPVIGAEFRIIVETDLKTPDLLTARYGQTLILIDPKTRIVKDKLHLTAMDYATARELSGEKTV